MPTIRDVAKRAGVSPITVSRVINDSGYVSPATRQRVETAIAELQYVPNTLARSLRSKRTKTIALVQSGSYQIGAVNFKVWEKHVREGLVEPARVAHASAAHTPAPRTPPSRRKHPPCRPSRRRRPSPPPRRTGPPGMSPLRCTHRRPDNRSRRPRHRADIRSPACSCRPCTG